jgi:hypothetical protein
MAKAPLDGLAKRLRAAARKNIEKEVEKLKAIIPEQLEELT